MSERPSWDDYFMSIALLVAGRSTCLRRKVGAVIVKDRRILATGYNGAPSGLKHCDETGCVRAKMNVPPGERHELCRGIHAEQNAIVQSANYGTGIDGASIYTTHHPCTVCAKMVINAGIKRVFTDDAYPDELASELLLQAGIEVVILGGAPRSVATASTDG